MVSKIKKMAPAVTLIISLLVFLLSTVNAAVVSALSQDTLHRIYNDTAWYKPEGSCSPAAVTQQATQDLDLPGIATKNTLQSILVQKLGADEVSGYRQNQPPNAAASMIKLIIVDVVLSKNVNLNQRFTLTNDLYYGAADQVRLGDTISLQQAIDFTLRNSSNNAANIVMSAGGGPSEVNQQAGGLGYKNTTIASYFHDTSSVVVRNNSTVEDIGLAMNKLYSGTREGDKVAQEALRGSSAIDGGGYGLSSEANKWALRNNPPVRGNSAVFSVKSAKYIITMYTNTDVGSNITNGTRDILSRLGSIGDSIASPASSGDLCCEGGTILPGNNNAERIWNYLVGVMGLNNTQAAGAMGNIKQESGFSPTADNGTHYGIVQWGGGRRTALENFAAQNNKPVSDLPLQLEFMKQELEGDYRSSVLDPIKASNNLAEVTRIWLERYEAPCNAGPDCDPEMNIRLPFAEDWLDGSGEGGGPSGPGGCGSLTGTFVWPMDKQYPVTSCYGYARGRLHTGVDIGAPSGADVVASEGGKVEQASNIDPGGFGNTIIIKHDSGKWTLYAHLREILVKVGDSVSQGQMIARSGGGPSDPGGGSSTGAHLHFNIQTAGGAGAGAVDPLKFLPRDGRGISGGDCPASLG